MHKVKVSLIFLVSIVSSLQIASAEPSVSATHCYRFESPSPASESNPGQRSERWCYQNISGTEGGTYIFNGDNKQVRPELALLKTKSGLLKQGSLSAGKVSVQSVKFRNFNPLSVPLEEPKDRRAESAELTAEFITSQNSVLALLQQAKALEGDLRTVEGLSSANANYMPWRGYWWPLKGLPIVGPMRKYDSFASVRGEDGGVAAWEGTHHVSHGIWWEGHCNGWIAAAILRPEPRSIRVDNQSGSNFTISDQKGLLSEADYCAKAAFFGFRHDHSSGIDPVSFHNALIHYIGQLHKPIAFNIDNNGPIDNRGISGYNMDIRRSGHGFIVTTTLRVHEYDGSISEDPGIAHIVSKTYQYSLVADENDTLTGGSWLSESPGFVWVPLSSGTCDSGNPNIKEQLLGSILRGME
jgi:hypothetical protein